MKFIHCAIRTNCLNESVDFYIDVFGFALREKRYIEAHKTTLVFLNAPGSNFEIELIATDSQSQVSQCENSFAHLAFQTDDIDGDVEKIKRKGTTFSREPFFSMDRSMKLVFLVDPNGITIELIEYLN